MTCLQPVLVAAALLEHYQGAIGMHIQFSPHPGHGTPTSNDTFVIHNMSQTPGEFSGCASSNLFEPSEDQLAIAYYTR